MPRLTKRGQVTIPIEVRERLALTPGTLVEVNVRGDTAVVRKLTEGSDHGRQLVDALRGRGQKRYTTDELMRLTRCE